MLHALINARQIMPWTEQYMRHGVHGKQPLLSCSLLPGGIDIQRLSTTIKDCNAIWKKLQKVKVLMPFSSWLATFIMHMYKRHIYRHIIKLKQFYTTGHFCYFEINDINMELHITDNSWHWLLRFTFCPVSSDCISLKNEIVHMKLYSLIYGRSNLFRKHVGIYNIKMNCGLGIYYEVCLRIHQFTGKFPGNSN